MAGKFRRIAYADRCEIAILLTRGVSRYDIADRIGVTPATIYRELRRGISGKRDSAGRLIYDPKYAEETARKNRQLSAKKPREIVGADVEPTETGRGGGKYGRTVR
jgi:IS30 family transposase